MNLPKHGRHEPGGDRAAVVDEAEIVRLDDEQLRELSTYFTPPRWLRDLGRSSWSVRRST